jgi:hypothetical protein
VDGTTDRQKENKKLLAIFEQDCKTIVEQDHLEQVFKEFETSKLCGLLDVQQAAFQISDGSTWQKWQASCDELAIFHHMLYDILKMSRDTHGAIEKDIILNEKFPMLATWLKIPWRAQENPHESKEWVESATLKYCKSPQFESPEGSKTFTPRVWGKKTTTVLTIATPEKQPWNSKYQDLGVHVTCCGKASHIFYTEKLFCLHVCSECPRRVLAPSPGLVVSMLTKPLCFGHIEFLPFALISLRDESLPPLTAASTPTAPTTTAPADGDIVDEDAQYVPSTGNDAQSWYARMKQRVVNADVTTTTPATIVAGPVEQPQKKQKVRSTHTSHLDLL